MSDRALRYALVDTALGCIGVAWSASGAVRLQLPCATVEETRQQLTDRLPAAQQASAADAPSGLADLLRRYALGEPVSFDEVVIDLSDMPPLRKEIYAVLRTIGRGSTTTYGEIARRVGAPGAARAVGSAMGANPLPVILPCHRVLASGGRAGGFSAPGGLDAKARLLALEGLTLDNGAPLLPGLFDAPGNRLRTPER